MNEGSGLENDSNSTTIPSSSPTTPSDILSVNAIINILASVVAVVFLTGFLCYTMHTFNRNEHKNRIRTALENNRLIDQQIAASKARAASKNQETNVLLERSKENLSSSDLPGIKLQNLRPGTTKDTKVDTRYHDQVPNSESKEETQILLGESAQEETVHTQDMSFRNLESQEMARVTTVTVA